MQLISVEDEYKKNPDLKRDDVKAIMEWAKKQPYLPQISERDVIIFLHSNYYSQEATKSTIDAYYTCKTHYTDIFENIDPLQPKNQNDMELIVFQPLPELTSEGWQVMFIKFMDTNAAKFNITDQIKILFMVIDLWLQKTGTAKGHFFLIDMSNITLSHVYKLNPMALKKFFAFLQDALPIRLKGFHFFNVVPFIDKILMIIKPVVKKELYELIMTHTVEGVNNLYKYVPKQCLPKDYGGNAPSVKELHETMKKHLKSHSDYFKHAELTHKVDETKRPESERKNLDFVGSFKKLDID